MFDEMRNIKCNGLYLPHEVKWNTEMHKRKQVSKLQRSHQGERK